MNLGRIKEVLNAEVLTGEEFLDREAISVCGSDLMSDVLAFSKDKAVLLTGLVNLQVIRTAEMMDMKAVVFLRGKEPSQEIVNLAKEKEIVVMRAEGSMFTSCGKLYSEGIGKDE